MLSTLLALALATQCPGGVCARPAYAYTYTYAPTAYQLADSTGQIWQHTDPAYLSSWVAARNATPAPQAPTAPAPGCACGCPVCCKPAVSAGPVGPPIKPPPPPIEPASPHHKPHHRGAMFSDPYGFGPALNAARAARGLGPLAYDEASSNAAKINSIGGFGHTYGGYGRGQCVAFGNPGTILAQWLGDPPHARILLDPGATSYGIGGAGDVWTVDIN